MSGNYALVDVNEIENKVLKKQKTKYLKEQVENIMKKIDKLNGKIIVKRANISRNLLDAGDTTVRRPNSIEIGSKMTSQQLHVKGMTDEKIILEESLSKLLIEIEKLQKDLPVEEPEESRREYLIRTGRLNPLEEKDINDDDLIPMQDPSKDVFLRDAQGVHNDYQDDGFEDYYHKRYNKWAIAKYTSRTGTSITPSLADIQAEEYKPLKDDYDVQLTHDLVVPGEIYHHLFEYQKTCLKWLYELNCQNVGGVLGDEMGLGKTVQIIAFLASLKYSKKLVDKGAILIVCPATVLRQWCQEFHKWWPAFRVVILHSSGTIMGGSNFEALGGDSSDYDSIEEQDNSTEESDDSEEEATRTSDEDEEGEYSTKRKNRLKTKEQNSSSYKKLKPSSKGNLIEDTISGIARQGGILLTTYSSMRVYKEQLLRTNWAYTILDEGHKIRNPDADVTITAKQLKTNNRIILSGTPIQNKLEELWSLYDFVYPGRLGTLPVFKQQFDLPIRMGGYINASSVQVQTAYKCACILKDFISPYLLRRLKVDVAQQLPKKTEQVLFCRLTIFQRNKYERYISSDEIGRILLGKIQSFKGIDTLRKLCNHPDLLIDQKQRMLHDYGNIDRSGKMLVVESLLRLWKLESSNNKVLLFCQTRQMLDIVEIFVRDVNKYQYLRMDGNTPIPNRARMVDDFNNNENIYIFLLTTRVGGLGINLTGANRIIIYDPDWNPSTDMQARERAWRLGQQRPVTIYRLLISGAIEEKIYHRQIYKQFLTNKVLKDAKQERFFKANDLKDLFTLEDRGVATETGEMFEASKVEVGIDAGDQDIDDDDTRILKSLFSNGVHSALQHDSIMDSSNPEKKLIDAHARKVALEAVEALRKSRKVVKQGKSTSEFAATWTGKSGNAGKPSLSLLANLRAKSGLAPKVVHDSVKTPADSMALNLLIFLKAEGGELVSSQAIMSKFQVRDRTGVSQIRVMLKEIADYRDSQIGKGWVLKPEFQHD